MLFELVYFGFSPRIALESSDSNAARLSKIHNLIRESCYSIHDISRLQSVGVGEIYRLNMAFELGIDIGAKRHGDENLANKRILILEASEYEYKKALSDISGLDIKCHHNEPVELVKAIRDWFGENVIDERLPGPTKIWYDFNDFIYYLNQKGQAEGFSEDDLKSLSVSDFVSFAKNWRSDNPR